MKASKELQSLEDILKAVYHLSEVYREHPNRKDLLGFYEGKEIINQGRLIDGFTHIIDFYHGKDLSNPGKMAIDGVLLLFEF